MTERPLPEPDSEELFSILGPSVLRILYGWLYRRRDPNPPTMGEVRLFMADAMGEPQEHIDRRLRELRRYFDIHAGLSVGRVRAALPIGWLVPDTAADRYSDFYACSCSGSRSSAVLSVWSNAAR